MMSTIPKVIAELERHESADEASATVALIRSKIIPMRKLPELLEMVGSAVDLIQAPTNDRLSDLRGAVMKQPNSDDQGVTATDIESAKHDVKRWLDEGYQIRLCFMPDYPQNLRTIFNRPPILFSVGDWDEEQDWRSVAVVGTRKATPSGINRARRLTRELCEQGVTILSGLAAGIDTAAHEEAIRVGGRTSAVMGTGIARIFPASNRALARRIRNRGALLSQFFPQQYGARWTFPQRNITMSGLSMATVVVEASETSGSRIQAESALEHGRPVFLLHSLVERTEWAHELVEHGKFGVRASVLQKSEDLLRGFEGLSPSEHQKLL